MAPFDDDRHFGDDAPFYHGLFVVGVVCIILGCVALSIDWLLRVF
jgi:hypothetical protein